MTLAKSIANCNYCGELFEVKRADQKYCNKYCRSAYHNDKKLEPNESVRENAWRISAYSKINGIIHRNRNIIEELVNKQQINRISTRDLAGYGFNFKYITGAYDDPDTGHYRFCYEWGYRYEETEQVTFFLRKEEIRC